MRGVENILEFVTLPQSPAETILGGSGGSEIQSDRESELCSVCSAGVIRTAIMIDFVPVPSPTPLLFFPLTISSSQAHAQPRT